jgi:hypothetical protein
MGKRTLKPLHRDAPFMVDVHRFRDAVEVSFGTDITRKMTAKETRKLIKALKVVVVKSIEAEDYQDSTGTDVIIEFPGGQV